MLFNFFPSIFTVFKNIQYFIFIFGMLYLGTYNLKKIVTYF